MSSKDALRKAAATTTSETLSAIGSESVPVYVRGLVELTEERLGRRVTVAELRAAALREHAVAQEIDAYADRLDGATTPPAN